MGQDSQADPSVGAAIVPRETADVVVAPSPPDLSPAPASAPAGAFADSPAGPPVASDVGMVEVPPLVVVSNIPVLGHEERATVVAEVGDRRWCVVYVDASKNFRMGISPNIIGKPL